MKGLACPVLQQPLAIVPCAREGSAGVSREGCMRAVTLSRSPARGSTARRGRRAPADTGMPSVRHVAGAALYYVLAGRRGRRAQAGEEGQGRCVVSFLWPYSFARQRNQRGVPKVFAVFGDAR